MKENKKYIKAEKLVEKQQFNILNVGENMTQSMVIPSRTILIHIIIKMRLVIFITQQEGKPCFFQNS